VLARRLPIVSVDPFKDWSITQTKPNQPSSTEAPSTGALKRPMASTSKDSKDGAAAGGTSNAKEMRTVSYYSTMLDLSKGAAIPDPEDSETTRPPLKCQVMLFSVLRILIYSLTFTFLSFSIRTATK
jgi:hypothetical protein